MTTALLNQLHDHKLTQIRARTQKQIELWREVIAVVKKAEQESKCIIALPEQLTNIAAVEKRVASGGYMEVMDMDGEINRLREQVYEFAVEKLNRMKEHLEQIGTVNTETSAQHEQRIRNAQNSCLKIAAYIGGFILLLIIWVFFSSILYRLFPNPSSSLDSFLGVLCFVVSVAVPVYFVNRALKLISPKNSSGNAQPSVEDNKVKMSRIDNSIEQIESHRSETTI